MRGVGVSMSVSAAPARPDLAAGVARPSGPDQALECSVVIHSFNRKTFLDRSLRTLTRDFDPSVVEIIVSDSGSTDGSRELVRAAYPQVRLVELTEDRGLAAGRNAGMRVAAGEVVLLIDEDVVVTLPEVRRLAALMREHPGAGLLTCCKVDEHGVALYRHHVPLPTSMNLLFFVTLEWSLQEGLRTIKRWLDIGERRPHQDQQLAEIPYVGGAVLTARAAAIEQVGPCDENIFFYGEDFDWCYRFRRAGWKILYFPQVTVQAFHGTNSARTKRASLVALRSRRYLFLKYVGRWYLPIYWPMALVGLIPKALYYLVQRRGGGAPDLSLSRWFLDAVRIIVGRPPAVALRD